MTATVDYLPIANEPGANVDTQSDYLAAITSGSLVNGYEAGLARSAQINKTLRQSSVIAAAIANYISEINGADVLDDGDVDALVDALGLAIRVGNTGKGADSGAANAYVVALSPAITSYADGLEVSFIADNSNTTSCTINVGGGVQALLRNDGTAMRKGDILAGDLVTCSYDLAATDFYMKSVTRSQIFQQGADLVSAATVDLISAVGNYLHVTGNTGPITSLGTAPAGYMAQVVFDSTPTLTYNATTLILPGAASVTVDAGTVGVFVSEGAGNWRCLFLQLAAGYPSKTGVQNQTYSSGTTGGSATAYTLTPLPANTALATNSLWFVTFHAAAGATPTLAVSGGTAKNIKYRNSAGTLTAINAVTTPINWSSFVVYDGTQYIQLSTPAVQATSATAQAMTSGTSKDFLLISPTAKKIEIPISALSTNGSSSLLVQIGTGGSPTTSGYLCSSNTLSSGLSAGAHTAGFGIPTAGASSVLHGTLILTLVDSATNTWQASGVFGDSQSGNPRNVVTGGSIALAGVLDNIRITVTNGTDTFDAGLANVVTVG